MKELARDFRIRQERTKTYLTEFKDGYMSLPLRWRVAGTAAFFGSAAVAGAGLGIAVSIAKLYI